MKEHSNKSKQQRKATRPVVYDIRSFLSVPLL